MSKKVVVINGSYRRENTFNVLTQIEAILNKNGIETEILNLGDYSINACNGCDSNCIKGARCCQTDDDMQKIREKILKCDGLILGSPVYMCGVTSRFKAFADRTNSWFHKPETAGIPVLHVATTASTGLKETVAFMQSLATGFGARQGGAVVRAGKAMRTPVTEAEAAKFLKLINSDKSNYKPSMNEIVLFQVQKTLASKSDGSDSKFFKDRGLDKAYYHYKCKMNPLKKGLARMMAKILAKAMG